MEFVKAAIGLVDSIFSLVERIVLIRIRLEVLRKHNVLGIGTAHWERIADNTPLRLTPKAKHLTQIMDKSRQDKPSGMPLLPDRLRGLEQMFNLSQVCVGVAIVDQGIEKLRRLPDALLTLVQAEVLPLFADHVVEGLVLMVQPVELRHTRSCLLIVLAELILALAFLIAAGEKIVPLIHVL